MHTLHSNHNITELIAGKKIGFKSRLTALLLTLTLGAGVMALPLTAQASEEGRRNTALALGATAAALLLTQRNKVPGIVVAGAAGIAFEAAAGHHDRYYRDYDNRRYHIDYRNENFRDHADYRNEEFRDHDKGRYHEDYRNEDVRNHDGYRLNEPRDGRTARSKR